MLQSPLSGTDCHPACLNIIHLLWQLNVYCCPKYKNNQQMHFSILFTKFSPTCFGQHSGDPQGDALVQEYKYKCG